MFPVLAIYNKQVIDGQVTNITIFVWLFFTRVQTAFFTDMWLLL